MSRYITDNQHGDGIDRRGFLNCMAWAGSGVLWSLRGGVARGQMMQPGAHNAGGGLSFVQISDSHIGFAKEPNTDVIGTLEEAVRRINALEAPPAFVVHTGDISHLSKPGEFDIADSILKKARAGRVIFLPGEHDVLEENGKAYLARYGKGTEGAGWFSFDQGGVHFIGLVNVLELKAGGLGSLGREQLEWMERELNPLSSEVPIVVFAHVPLWTVYEQWGWGTEDGMQALAYLRRFGSVTVLNGHIHQAMQKVEGNMVFHTAASTAFPQPAPGMAASPGPWKVPTGELRRHLGLTDVRYAMHRSPLAIVDKTLEGEMPSESSGVKIENFAFTPLAVTVRAGDVVTWTNHDDIPHNVVAADKSFSSPVLDTGETFTHRFEKPGEYSYFCSLHPKMTGRLKVRNMAAMVVLLLLASLAHPLQAKNSYAVHNLVSDIPGAGDQTDSNLVNPWGLASSATSPFWVANNGAGNTTVYDSSGKPFPTDKPLIVGIPPATGAAPRSAPTGEVFNDTSGFELPAGKPAQFLFASEDGTISGWNRDDGDAAITMVDNSTSGAIYKGLAVAETPSGPRLYAANFSAGTIDVFDGRFSPVAAAGGFAAPGIPAGFAPFNVQRIGRRVYVAYARQDGDRHDDVAGEGNGFIVTFDLDGYLQNYLVSNGPLNSPWGMALAPETFGDFGYALLVGNFGDGRINAFDPCTGEPLGSLRNTSGAAIVIPGLWALRFGNGRSGGDATALYFTAGIAGDGDIEDHGLFGSIQPAAPSPAAVAVGIDSFRFLPPDLTVAAGAQVKWTNAEGVAHTVAADVGAFRSATLDGGQSYAFTFNTPGVYGYHCSIHPFMKGTVTVTGEQN